MIRTYIVYSRATDGSPHWHWKKECPDFPVNKNIEAMVCTAEIPANELCPTCYILDTKLPSTINSIST